MSGVPESFWTGVPIGRDVTRIVSDVNGLAAFVKPAGVLSHPNQSSDQPKALVDARYTLDGEFYEWRDAAGAVRRLWLLNRLDSATSGVMLVALPSGAGEHPNEAARTRREAEKTII